MARVDDVVDFRAVAELLAAAEADGFDVLLTTGKNMPYQQSLAGRRIAVVVLGLQQWPSLRPNVGRVVEAIKAARPGSYTEIEFPESDPKRSHPEQGS